MSRTRELKTIMVDAPDFAIFDAIKASRPEDRTRADTFHYIMEKFEAKIA